MQIDYTGRQMEITPDLRQYTEERLQKFSRLLQDRWHTHVTLTAQRHRRVAEIRLKVRDHVLVGIAETADARDSINGAWTSFAARRFGWSRGSGRGKGGPSPLPSFC